MDVLQCLFLKMVALGDVWNITNRMEALRGRKCWQEKHFFCQMQQDSQLVGGDSVWGNSSFFFLVFPVLWGEFDYGNIADHFLSCTYQRWTGRSGTWSASFSSSLLFLGSNPDLGGLFSLLLQALFLRGEGTFFSGNFDLIQCFLWPSG